MKIELCLFFAETETDETGDKSTLDVHGRTTFPVNVTQKLMSKAADWH